MATDGHGQDPRSADNRTMLNDVSFCPREGTYVPDPRPWTIPATRRPGRPDWDAAGAAEDPGSGRDAVPDFDESLSDERWFGRFTSRDVLGGRHGVVMAK